MGSLDRRVHRSTFQGTGVVPRQLWLKRDALDVAFAAGVSNETYPIRRALVTMA